MPAGWAAAAAAIGGALLSSDASSDASNAQGAMSDRAIQAQKEQFNQTQAANEPFQRTGTAANQTLSQMLGLNKAPASGPKAILRGNLAFDEKGEYLGRFGHGDKGGGTLEEIAPTWGVGSVVDESGNAVWNNPGAAPQASGPANDPSQSPLLRKFTVGDFMADPVNQLGMQYGLDQGSKAIDRGAGAAGLRNSGATLKALTRFGQDYAGSKAGDSYNRFVADQGNIYNRLAGISGTGQTAVAQTGQLGANAATNVGNIMSAQGNARGAAAISQGNSYSGAANNIGNYYTQQNMLDKILANKSSSGGVSTSPSYSGYGADGSYAYG